MRVPIQIEHLVASAASVWLQTQDSDAEGTFILANPVDIVTDPIRCGWHPHSKGGHHWRSGCPCRCEVDHHIGCNQHQKEDLEAVVCSGPKEPLPIWVESAQQRELAKPVGGG